MKKLLFQERSAIQKLITHLDFAVLQAIKDDYKSETEIRNAIGRSESVCSTMTRMVRARLVDYTFKTIYNYDRKIAVRAYRCTKLGHEALLTSTRSISNESTNSTSRCSNSYSC